MILCTQAVENSIGNIFTDYDLAYIGNHFSQSFLRWLNAFNNDIKTAYETKDDNFQGVTCNISALLYSFPNEELVMCISEITFDLTLLLQVKNDSYNERIQQDRPNAKIPIEIANNDVNNYTFINSKDGGVYNDHHIIIVKKKRCNRKRPCFNYYDTETKQIMFNRDFLSPFPFENNQAFAWATDGHKYQLPQMQLIENKTYKTMSKIRLTESQLHNVIRRCINEALDELDWKTYANANKKMRERGNMSYWREQGFDDIEAFKRAGNARRRAKNLGDAAKAAFNRDYGYSNGSLYDKDASNVQMGGDFDATEEFGPHAVGYQDKGYGNPYKYSGGRRYDGCYGTEMTPEEFFNGNQDAAAAYKKGNQDIKNWKSGKSKYTKGKGWE